MTSLAAVTLGVLLFSATLNAAPAEDVEVRPGGNSLSGTSPVGPPKQETKPPALERREPQYRLEKGDAFDLEFPLTPEFNQQGVTVQPDGFVSLRNLGQVPAEGKTVPELTDSLRQRYAPILHDPAITVVLKDFEKPYFIATGQVGRPGKFELRGDVSVSQGLAMAGGLTMTARHSRVLLFRRQAGDWYEVKEVNLKHLLQARKTQEDLRLQSGDMIVVPTSSLGNIKRVIPGWALSTYVNPIP
jgi:polysaccharide export outer membrane protein